MLHLTSSHDLFCDAFFIHQDCLMFASLHGRDCNVLSFMAALSAPTYQGGLYKLSFKLPQEKHYSIEKTATVFQKLKKRITKYMTHNFGLLTHAFLYHDAFLEPDRENKSSWIIQDDLSLDLDKAIWECVKHLSDIPLLDHWQIHILAMLTEQDSIKRFYPNQTKGNVFIHAVQAAYVSIPSDFDQQTSQMLKQGLISA